MNSSMPDVLGSVRNLEAYRTVLAGVGALTLGVATHGVMAPKADAMPVRDPAIAAANHPTLTFDDLGGGSSIIEVFPGVKKTATDRAYNGTFNDGDEVGALCKTAGRLVRSDPSVGEKKRSSQEWIRIKGTPGETQYATAVYAVNPTSLLKRLKTCVTKK